MEQLAESLATLFNKSFKDGALLLDWVSAMLRPYLRRVTNIVSVIIVLLA